MSERTITWIDSLKGIGMCGVIMIHMGGNTLPSILGSIGAVGKNGVQIFFLFSALLSYVSLERFFACHREQINIKSVLPWWKKKFLKLVPLYYLAIIVCMLVQGGSSYWLGSEKIVTVKNIFAHIFFLHGLFPHYADSIIGVEWYLGVLAIFYICVPLIYKYIDSVEKAVSSCLISVIFYYFIRKCAKMLIPAVADAYIYSSYVDTFWIFAQLPVLFMGIVLFFILRNNCLEKVKSKKVLSYALLIFALVMILGQALGKNKLFMVNEYTLFGLWFLCISVSQILWRCPLVDNAIFRKLGRYSYPIYLFHGLIIILCSKFYTTYSDNKVINWGIQYLIVIGVVLVFSVVVVKYFDNPINNWLTIKSIGKRRKSNMNE